MAVPPANLATAITALWEAAGATVPVRGSAGSGVVHAALPGTLPVGQISDALAAVRRHGFCTVLGAPPAVHNAVDVWGPVPGLALMRRVKEQFDPRRLLSPGRFVGGI
jgi:glycolate oxidase FAD binding subunit